MQEIILQEPTAIQATLEITPPACNGTNDGLANVSISGGTPPYSYLWANTETTSSIGNLSPGPVAVTVTDSNGCTWEANEVVEEPLPIALSATIVDVTCPEGKDGSVDLTIENAAGAVEILWSNGQSGEDLTGIPSGAYSVDVVDENSCTASLDVNVQEPAAPFIDILAEDISCSGLRDGNLLVLSPIDDGYTYSLDGENFTDFPEFSSLEEGAYTLVIKDGVDCLFEVPFGIQDAPEALVATNPSPDTIIQLGQTVELEAFPYPTVTTLNWVEDPTLSCTECLTTLASPLETTIYTVQVATADGCTDEVNVTVLVKKEDDLFIPNGFSPNADGNNDRFTVFAGQSVVQIDYLRVFNRWGGMVFEQTDFLPNDPNFGWDGWFNGQPLTSDVYVYLLQVTYLDGRQEVFKGDITLVR